MIKNKAVRDEVVKAAAKTEAATAAAKKEAVKAVAKAKEETTKITKAAEEKADSAKAAAKTVKKVVKKKAAGPKTEIYLQFADREYTNESIIKMVKEVWTKQMKKKIGDMKTLQVYVKPEEFAAYYVINGDVVGRVEL